MSELYPTFLNPGEIRLLTIEGPTPGAWSCTLSKPLKREDEEYDALSYTWGEPEPAEITCNGQPLAVTPSLYEALKHLSYAHPKPVRRLWVDAICLNQNSEAEKQLQLPDMDKIYKHAKRVIIWLGPANDNSDEVFDQMQEFRSGLDTFKKSGQDGFPHPEHRFWPDLGRLFRRSWFGRLWTLQEVVLADEKVIMCGDRTVSWADFTDLIMLTLRGECRIKINGETASDFTTITAIVSVGHVNKAKSLMNSESGPELLLTLLTITRSRECGLHSDRIYAILGLIKFDMREDIVRGKLVDYTLGHMNLFKKIARRYLLTTDNGLEVLSLADATTRSPSWCPDWTAKLVYGRVLAWVPSYTAGISPAWEHRGNTIKLDDDDEDAIHVHGFFIDRVQTVGIPWPTGASDDDLLTPWMENAFSIATSVSSSLQTYVRTLMGNVMRDMSPCTGDFSGEYKMWRHEMNCSNVSCPRRPHDPEIVSPRRGTFFEALGTNLISRRFFSTISGRIGVGPRELKSGDQVCVFKNGKPLYVLREVSEVRDPSRISLEESDVKKTQKDRFRLVGEAYVDGLMSGEAFGMSSRGPATDFCII